MSDETKCPFCGSKAYDRDADWFECGTIRLSEGNFAGTLNCKNLAEFRKPFDAKIEQLERDLNAANERINRMAKVGFEMIENGSVSERMEREWDEALNDSGTES